MNSTGSEFRISEQNRRSQRAEPTPDALVFRGNTNTFLFSEQEHFLTKKPNASVHSAGLLRKPIYQGCFPNVASLPFRVAFHKWLDSRVSIAPATRLDYLKNYNRMEQFFGNSILEEITIEDINKYRQLRLKRCGPNRINKELNMLSQMMKKAGCWDAIGKWYERLPEDREQAGMALEPEEEAHLFLVASSRPKWRTAYLSSLLMRNTCICFGELRLVTLGDVDTENFAWIRVRHGKNRFRKRTLPCNTDAQWALRALVSRARSRGKCLLPEHYLLPGRGPNPEKPLDRAPYKAWWSLRKKAAEKFPRLAKVKFYDMRRTILTNLLEHPQINYNVIEGLMGHKLGSDIKRVYDYRRSETLQQAADLVSSHIKAGL